MARRETPQEFGDRDFERLFQTFDNIEASDELKNATLDAIFGQADAEGDAGQGDTGQNALAKGDKTSKTAVVGTPLRLVKDEPEPSDEGRTKVRKKKRGRRWMLRVAAVALVAVLGVAGGLAYALPVSHVVLTMDDTTFDLGMNVFGMTVSASSGNAAGTSTLTKAQVRNKTLDDAIKTLMGAYEGQGGSGNVTVDAFSRFGGKDSGLSQRAQEAVKRETRGWETGSKEPAANSSVAQQQSAPSQTDERQRQEAAPRENAGASGQQSAEPRQEATSREEPTQQGGGNQPAQQEGQTQRAEPEMRPMDDQGVQGNQMGQGEQSQGQGQEREQIQPQGQGQAQGQDAQNGARQNQPMAP